MDQVWKTDDTITAAKLNGDIAYTTAETYTGDKLTQVDESIGGVLRRRNTYTYTGDDLTGINVKVYDTDGATVVGEYNEVLAYAGGVLAGTTRTVVT